MVFTSSALRVGLASSIKATTPAVAGLLMLVPESLPKSYVVPSHSAWLVTLYEPSRNELKDDSTLTPGADTLGFKRSSNVGP